MATSNPLLVPFGDVYEGLLELAGSETVHVSIAGVENAFPPGLQILRMFSRFGKITFPRATRACLSHC